MDPKQALKILDEAAAKAPLTRIEHVVCQKAVLQVARYMDEQAEEMQVLVQRIDEQVGEVNRLKKELDAKLPPRK